MLGHDSPARPAPVIVSELLTGDGAGAKLLRAEAKVARNKAPTVHADGKHDLSRVVIS